MPSLENIRAARVAVDRTNVDFRALCVAALDDHPLRQVAIAANVSRDTLYAWKLQAAQGAARTAKSTPADRAWTCRECDTRITDVQPETWQAIPCGHYVTHVQMVTMTYGPPSWPVALSMEPLTAKPDTEETP
jgi:hypothetical protein